MAVIDGRASLLDERRLSSRKRCPVFCHQIQLRRPRHSLSGEAVLKAFQLVFPLPRRFPGLC
jgi:hypothetical protein